MSSAGLRIVVAMSGGVDSSVAAALLLEAGARVEGVSLRLWDSSRRDDRVCSDARDAGKVAAALGIPHATIDERSRFEREVVRGFVDETASGRTPNPCMACNSRFKLGILLDWARERGADAVATGHYARVDEVDGRPRLRRAVDAARDQSYFLFELRPAQLRFTRFPLGGRTKPEVRDLARRYGLPTAEKRDSQDLCFGSPAALVAARGRGGTPGEIVDVDGRKLGRHAGIERFTIGQRRGLGIAAARPFYVQETHANAAQVVVASAPPHAIGVEARSFTWIVDPESARQRPLRAKLRSRHEGIAATLEDCEGERVRLGFPEPAVAVTPGQAVVLYDGDEVVGGGWIERSIRSGESVR